MCASVRIIKPAPTSSSVDTATSTITRIVRLRSAQECATTRAVAASASIGRVRLSCQAGSSEKNTPVTSPSLP